ncbi:MAG: hypothetical protein N2376_11465 [Clostridia bacterium]|nr:hypothetical protein [Clostridia bacterium]
MAGYNFAPHTNKYSNQYIFVILLERLTQFVGLYFSIITAGKLLKNAFLGGALFIGGQLIMLFSGIFGGKKRTIPSSERLRYMLYIPFTVLILFYLVFKFPLQGSRENLYALLLFIGIQFISFYLFVGTPLSPPGTTRYHRKPLPYCILCLMAIVLFLLSAQMDTSLLMALYFLLDAVLIGLYRFLLNQYPSQEQGTAHVSPEILKSMMQVYSYKLYWLMTANTSIAFEISMVLMICYLPFLPVKSLELQLVNALLFIVLYCIAAILSRLILQRKAINDLGKNSVFMLFSIIWIATNLYLYQHTGQMDAFQFGLAYLLLCMSITALAFINISMDRDMQIVGTLQIENLNTSDYNALKALLHHWSLFFSRFIMLIVVSFLALFTAASPGKGDEAITVLGRYGLTLLPVLFILLGLLAALKQPLTRLYEDKLKKYIVLKSEGKPNQTLEERLKLVLVKKYSKRLGIKLIMILLKPFFRHKVIGSENVDTSRFPAIFVCNHSEIYGPVAAVLNIPFFFRPWILNDMVDPKRISEHIQQGTFDRQKWMPRFFRERAGRLFGPWISWLMKSMEPIPVFRNDGRDILKGLSMSVEALEAEDNILLFPENPIKTGGYVREGVGEFFSGFVNIARDYFKKTGKPITFYAIFVDKRKRTLSFSEGISYEGLGSFHEEKKRITGYLYEEMCKLAEQDLK